MKIGKTKEINMVIAVCIAILAVLPILGSAQTGYVVTRLTTNDYADYRHDINNGNIVWTGYYSLTDSSTDGEIYLYDGVKIKQLTDNSYNDWNPSIDGGKVSWEAQPDMPGSMDSEIFYYDGINTIRLTYNNVYDGVSKIDNGKVVWGNFDGNDAEIFLYDGTTVAQLTNNNYNDYTPSLDDGIIVWKGTYSLTDPSTDLEIYMYDGTIVKQLTNNNYEETPYGLDISNGKVVWEAPYSLTDASTDREVYMYDGTIVKQLTSDDFDENFPNIDNEKIVWIRSDQSHPTDSSEIFLYDIATSTETRLTDNNYYDGRPKISNGKVVWSGDQGFHIGEIYLYDGTSTIKLTENSYDDDFPLVNKDEIVWIGRPSAPNEGPYDNSYSEIFLAMKPVQAVETLDGYIDNMNIPDNIKTSLKAPLAEIDTILKDNNPQNDISACYKLTAFINDVNAKKSSGKLTTEEANTLLQKADEIKNSLGC